MLAANGASSIWWSKTVLAVLQIGYGLNVHDNATEFFQRQLVTCLDLRHSPIAGISGGIDLTLATRARKERAPVFSRM